MGGRKKTYLTGGRQVDTGNIVETGTGGRKERK
jgi:hypothetical protein